jgi:hypothetical protein
MTALHMGIVIGHLIVVALALAACFAWWTSASSSRTVRAIVAVGLLARAVPGLALFWISAHRLPIGSSLQLDPGFWFFGLDAETYYRLAAGAATRGPGAIAALAPILPSVFYIKSLAAALYVFGLSPATSLLFNLLAYAALISCAIRWHARSGSSTAMLLVTVSAVSLAPSWILWTYQPLKDTYFLLLATLFFSAADAWYARLTADRWSWSAFVSLLIVLAAMVYGLSGLRWYFALLIVSVMPLALFVVTFGPRGLWSGWRVVGAVVSLVVLFEIIVPGAGPFLPRWLHSILRPSNVGSLWALRESPKRVASTLESVRAHNVVAQGATLIHVIPDEGSGLTAPSSRTAEPGSDGSAAEKMRGNLATLLLPRALAFRVGHVSIGGGRGLWAFADLDTVFFDLAIFASAWVIWRELRGRGRVRPSFWHILGVTAAITLLLAYEAANFGTLFRMRSMIAIGVALMPLTIDRISNQAVRKD